MPYTSPKYTAARAAANERLKADNLERWTELYEEEALARGITPRSVSHSQELVRLRARIAELEEAS